MPCRSGRQLLSLYQYDISPAQFGQVIEHRGTDNTAANYNHSSMFFHIRS